MSSLAASWVIIVKKKKGWVQIKMFSYIEFFCRQSELALRARAFREHRCAPIGCSNQEVFWSNGDDWLISCRVLIWQTDVFNFEHTLIRRFIQPSPASWTDSKACWWTAPAVPRIRLWIRSVGRLWRYDAGVLMLKHVQVLKSTVWGLMCICLSCKLAWM